MFFLAASLVAGFQHPGLMGAESRDNLFEVENMRIALSQIVLAIYKFQPGQIHSLSPKLLPGINTKRIVLHRLFKEINYKPLLLAKQVQLPEIFCVKHS